MSGGREGIITGRVAGQALALRNFVLFWREQLEKGSGVARKTKKRERRRRMDSVPLLLLLLGRVLAS